MSIEIRDSANYAATVIRVPKPFDLPNADRLVGLGVFGYTVITEKNGSIKEGSLAVFFPAESQLSAPLVEYANLYRHSELNRNPEEKGYLEDNRRVRALKLRGTVSNGLLLPAGVVERFVEEEVGGICTLEEGYTFDHFNGGEICRKYRVKEPVAVDRSKAKVNKAFKRVDSKFLPEHIETDQWLRNEHLVSDEETLIVTQKLHGTSVRLGNIPVKSEPTLRERVAKFLGVRVQESYYDLIAGSRKVIKDPKNTAHNHFYSADIWTNYLSRVQDVLPENIILYGELVGFTDDGAPIQKGHTYAERPGEHQLYVYRISVITNGGDLWDLSWEQVKYFCKTRGLSYTPELWRGKKSEFVLEDFEEKAFHKGSYSEVAVPLSPGGTGADEGIVIRVDREGQVPALYKFKNASHYLYETAILDSGEIDLESEESV